MNTQDLVAVGEAARILSRHPNTVLDYEKSGRLPIAFRQPLTNNRLWPRRVVVELAKQLEVREPMSV